MEPLTAARRAERPINILASERFRPDSPEMAAVAEAAGVEGSRRFFVYLAGRPSPLGGSWRVAHAVMGLFPPALVDKAMVRVTANQPFATFASGYAAACDELGARLFQDLPDAAELAGLLDGLVAGMDYAGRPLAAAWAQAPGAANVGAVIERMATVLREHRGDGHQSALLATGLLGPEAMLVTELWRGAGPEDNARFFGWRDDDLVAAWQRLAEAGRVDAGRQLTPTGREERSAIEETTEALAAAPWTSLSPAERERTVQLLEQAAGTVDGYLVI